MREFDLVAEEYMRRKKTKKIEFVSAQKKLQNGQKKDSIIPIGSVLNVFFERSGFWQYIAESNIVLNWGKLLPGKLGETAKIREIKDHVIFVEVETGEARYGFEMSRELILKKIQKEHPKAAIEDIVVSLKKMDSRLGILRVKG